MQKRVAFIVGTLQTGGIERSVTDWCLYLRARTDWQPFVICILKRSGPFLKVLEENVVCVEECKLHERGFVRRLKQLLRQINPSVVHSQVAFSMPWQVLAILLSGKRKIIFTQQNEYQNWTPLGARLRLKLYFWIFFRFIYHYTCVSEKVRESLCDLTGLNKQKFKIIPNGVNTDFFCPDPEQRKKQRQLLNLDEFFVVGMVARFNPQKGHVYLIDAVRMLKEWRMDFRVVLVGVGELETEIRQMVMKYDLSDLIIFHGQAIDVQQVLQAFDCFVLPSLWEGMPLSLLEAMATGLPVIGTDVAGTREVLKPSVNGLLIPPKDPEAIMNAVRKLMEDPQFKKRVAEKGLTFVRKTYSVASNIESYLKLYAG